MLENKTKVGKFQIYETEYIVFKDNTNKLDAHIKIDEIGGDVCSITYDASISLNENMKILKDKTQKEIDWEIHLEGCYERAAS